MKKLRGSPFVFMVIVVLVLLGAVANAKPPKDLTDELVKNKKTALEKTADPNAWFAYAMSCAYTGKLDEGLDALKKVDSIDDTYAKKITPVLKKKVEESPNSWRDRFYYAFAVYALTLDKNKNKMTKQEEADYQEESVNQFKDIIKLLGDKNYISAWSQGYIAAIRGEQGRFQESIPLLRSAIKVEPDGLYLHLALGYAYMKTGNIFGLIGESLTVGRLKADEKNPDGPEDNFNAP